METGLSCFVPFIETHEAEITGGDAALDENE